MAQPKKRATRARKCKCKCHIKEKTQIVKKGQQIGKNDTLPRMQARPPADVAPTIRVRLKKK